MVKSQSGTCVSSPPSRVVADAVGEVIVLRVAGPLAEAADELDLAVAHGLAEEPRAVVCDLSAATDGAPPARLQLLTSSSWAAWQWPGVPVAVCSPDAAIRAGLRRDATNGHVMVRSSLPRAISGVHRRPEPRLARLGIEPRMTAGRTARDFVSRACLDWGLRHGVASACLVISELVTNAVVHAGGKISLSLACVDDRLRLAVRDRSSSPPQQPGVKLERGSGRGLLLVEGFSDAWGYLPTTDGGKVVWAVLHT
jgi:anti-sigma regulatory factor (Ser/Thr protein kinase)